MDERGAGEGGRGLSLSSHQPPPPPPPPILIRFAIKHLSNQMHDLTVMQMGGEGGEGGEYVPPPVQNNLNFRVLCRMGMCYSSLLLVTSAPKFLDQPLQYPTRYMMSADVLFLDRDMESGQKPGFKMISLTGDKASVNRKFFYNPIVTLSDL